jgi:hypothetical protein
MTVALRQYYLAFGSLRGFLGPLSFLPPFVGALMPESAKFPNYFYPPLGDFRIIAAAGTIALTVLSSYFVYLSCEKSPRKMHPTATLALSVIGTVCLIALMGFYIGFVKVVRYPAVDTELTVSIGYDRTEFVTSSPELRSLTDSELLYTLWASEDRIQKLWTIDSIMVVRASLGLCYAGCLICWVSILSLGVYQHALSEGASGRQSTG